ncbi:MAG: hypothetical protein K2Q24_09265 [Chitinophagaceae bacterium]|nr:hypothetical protein [Chitinophagaceae bacterium]
MKKIKFLMLATVAFTLILQSCQKKEVLGNFDSLGVGSYLTLEKANKVTLDYSQINNESVSITVKEFGSNVDKVIVYVTAGAATLNKANWKKIKEYTYTSATPLDLVIRATEIATALGTTTSALNPGTAYTLYNEVITKDGKTYNAVNTVGALASNPNYRASTTWTANVVCPFVPAGFPGNFVVREDEWQDWGPGDFITVTSAGTDSINIRAYPNPSYGVVLRDITVKIAPATGIAKVTDQLYGDYQGAFGLNRVAVTSDGTSNFVFACTGTIDLRLFHHVPGALSSNYGRYWLRLTKQ